MPRQDDYERMPPRKANARMKGQVVQDDADRVCVGVVHDAEDPSYKRVAVNLAWDDGRMATLILGKDGADLLIRDLIATRNELWPTP